MKNKFSENYQNLIKIYANLHNNGTTWDNPRKWEKIISKFKIKYPNISPFVICSTSREQFITVS